jgi:hypothetical protein
MLTAIAVVIAVAISITGAELLRFRMRWIAWTRRGETIEVFERHCVARGYPVEIARAAYLHLQRCAGVRGFPVRPNDSLALVYGMEQDDVADLLCLIALTAQCEDVTDERARTLGAVLTVDDAVRVLTPLFGRWRATRGRAASGATGRP